MTAFRAGLAPRGTGVLGVGSLPHLGPDRAAALALRTNPGLPTAPQLPARGEGMLAQLLPWLAGLEPGPDGGLLARAGVGALRAGVETVRADGPGRLPSPGWAGALALAEAVRAMADPPPVKLQLTGPCTLAVALARAGAGWERAAEAALSAHEQAAAALLGEFSAAAAILLVLDEPVLGRPASAASVTGPAGGRPESRDGAFAALLGEAVRRRRGRTGLAVGVHCCAPGGAEPAARSGADLVSVPLAEVGEAGATALAELVARGGRVAWGVMPSDGRARPEPSVAAGALERWWAAHPGPDWAPASLVSPDCGLGLRSLAEAEAILDGCGQVARRLGAGMIAA